ncbi:MAG: hypothetical protein ACI35Q_00610 [Marinilabiliaceae bacterium]
MIANCLTVEIAGITFRFHCQERDLDCAQLRPFEKRGEESDDQVDIEVRSEDSVATDVDGEVLFTARKEATTENEEAEWDLLRIASTGEEMIIQRSGATHNIRCASIRFTAHRATLAITPVRDPGGAINPLAYPIFNIFLSRILSYRHGFLIHSSVVKDTDGRGYLFTAKSGTGKSTIAHLFEGEGATIVNDDMIAVRTSPAHKGKATAYSIPMPYYTQQPLTAELSGIFFISQSPTNRIERLSDAEATARLLSNMIHQPYDKTATATTVADAIRCATSTTGYALGFKPDGEVVETVRMVMRQK